MLAILIVSRKDSGNMISDDEVDINRKWHKIIDL